MKTLVLNVDRDDDFGRKAKVKSPIIGVKDNIEAANKLGQADPEDSDLNAIFSAISTYNTLKNEGKKVEIATICGNISVGLKSDEILSEQIEKVIKETNADEVILITDGAEDEYILPLIQSRIKITSINRVSVKQSRELEDAYYRILKILDDEKVQKQFLLPIALVLIVWAFFVIIDMASSGFGAILLTLGLYLLIRVFRWERNLAIILREVKSGFLTGKLSVYTYIIAIVILLAYGVLAYYELTNTVFTSEIEFIPVLFFINRIIWGIVIAGLIAVFGRVIDVYVKDKKTPWRYWIAPFSIFAIGFISYALTGAFYEAFIFYIAIGVMIALIGIITYHYIKELYSIDDNEPEIEKQTKKAVE